MQQANINLGLAEKDQAALRRQIDGPILHK